MSPPAYHVGSAAVTENLLKRKWSITILRHLANGITDPAEITKREAELSTAALNERLRNMLRFGLIARFPRPAASKTVEYRLTPRGHKILKVLNFIEQLDHEASQQDRNGEERILVAVRRKKVAPSASKRLILNV
jgi:DNA-binding HxlR family transcriptional regulator